MLGLTYEDIIAKIKEAKGLADEEIQLKLKEKLTKLSGLISKEGAAHIVANELGINLIESIRRDGLKITKLAAGMRGITVFGKVVKTYPVRSFTKNNHEGKVGSFLIGDDTALVRVVLWDVNQIQQLEQEKINEGVIVKVQDAYVRENQGFKEIHLGNQSTLALNPEGVSINVMQGGVSATPESVKKRISELQAGDSFVTVLGTVVQVFEPRFYEACPECNKKVVNGTCAEHGSVVAKHVPILNFFFDDGTSNIRAVAFRDHAALLLNVDEQTLLSMREDLGLFDTHKKALLGKQFHLVGRVTKNDMFQRIEFSVQQVLQADPEKITSELTDTVTP